MQSICQRKDLYDAVQTVARAVSGRSTLPILSHILVQPQGDSGLKLSATDLEVRLECVLPARVTFDLVDDDNAGFTVPARVFAEMLAALPEAEVTLDRPEGGNKIQVRCSRSDVNLLGLPAEEYPAAPDVDPAATLTLSGAMLKAMIRQVLFAVSTDESRAILTGVLLLFNGQAVKMVATDTHRLAVRSGLAVSGEGEGQAVLPARALNELSRLAGDDDAVTISIGSTQASFEVWRKVDDKANDATTIGGMDGKFSPRPVTMISRLISGQFPNYERVIPGGHERKLTLETSEFSRAVKRVGIVARDEANRVVLETQGAQLVLSAVSGKVGSVRDEIEVAREGDDIQIAFNAKYMTDVLNVIDTEGVVLELTEPLRPGIVRPIGDGAEDYLCVLMPMQVI